MHMWKSKDGIFESLEGDMLVQHEGKSIGQVKLYHHNSTWIVPFGSLGTETESQQASFFMIFFIDTDTH